MLEDHGLGVFDLLDELSISPSDVARIQGAWAQRIEASDDLRDEAQEIARRKPCAVPRVEVTRAELRPFPWTKQAAISAVELPGPSPSRLSSSFVGDAFGAVTAIHARTKTGKGQVVDVALYEAVFNCMESLLPEYSAFGAVRQPAGSALPGIAPSNAYRCADGQVVIGGNGDSIFKRLMAAIGRDDLGADPGLADNAMRAARVDELDAAITAWTVQRPVAEVVAVLQAASVPAGRIYTVADIATDPHFLARGMIEQTTTPDGLPLAVPGIVPKLSATPGSVRSSAPRLGDDTDAVLAELGLAAEAIAALRARNVVA